MSDQRDIVFRRVRGRIVPIKRKKKAEGAAIAGAGVATTWGVGRYAAGLERDAANMENTGRTMAKQARKGMNAAKVQGPLFEAAALPKFHSDAKKAMRTVAKSQQFFRASKNFKLTGLAIGSSLIATGVYRALSGNDEGKGLNAKEKAAVSTVAGSTAALGIRAAYEHKLGPRKGFKLVRDVLAHVVTKRFGR